MMGFFDQGDPRANVKRKRTSEAPPKRVSSMPPRATTETKTSKALKAAESSLARRFLVLWAVAVLATGVAFIAHLALRFETIRLGYELGAARREQHRLRDQERVLSLEAATLKQPARVETIARTSLGMGAPDVRRIVPMSGRGGQRSAGRTR